MVERILQLFNKEFGGLHQAAFLLGGFAILSQILALIRDRIFAYHFGASTTLDIYYAAFRVPDFIFVSVASLVSFTVLVPLLVKALGDGKEETKKLINNVFTVFVILIIFVSMLAFFLVPYILPIIFPGFVGDEKTTLITLTQILLLSPILLGISSLLGSVTQVFRRFLVYGVSPVLYNVGIIFGVLFLYPSMGILGMGLGVVLGALFHMAIQLPVIVRQGFTPRFLSTIDWKQIKEIIFLSLPRTIGLSVNQIAMLVLVSMASLMVEGSITVFNFAYNLQSVPLAIIGVSYSVAAFPTLSRMISKNNISGFLNNISNATRHILFWSLPVVILFIVLRAQIVRSILGSGEFNWADTRLTAATLALFVVSVAAQALVLLFVRGFYAAGITKKPVIINIISAFSIVIFGFVFIKLFQEYQLFRFFAEALFRVEDIPGTIVIMLPLAFSVGSFINIVLLLWIFREKFGKLPNQLARTFWESFLGAVFMGFIAYKFLQIFAKIFNLETFIGIFLQGLLSGIFGVIAGILLLKILGNREIKDISNALHTRFWKTQIVAPDKDEL